MNDLNILLCAYEIYISFELDYNCKIAYFSIIFYIFELHLYSPRSEDLYGILVYSVLWDSMENPSFLFRNFRNILGFLLRWKWNDEQFVLQVTCAWKKWKDSFSIKPQGHRKVTKNNTFTVWSCWVFIVYDCGFYPGDSVLWCVDFLASSLWKRTLWIWSFTIVLTKFSFCFSSVK